MPRTANPSKVYIIIFYLLIFFSAFSNKITAQTGSIEGFVLDKSTNVSIIGATVIIEGTNHGTVTDADGRYSFSNVKEGFYNIKITYVSYDPFVRQNIHIEEGKKLQVNALMQASSVNLSEVTITATKRSGSNLSLISTIRTNQLVASGISSQQIHQSQERDAAEVVRRIPGITIIGDRFIIVRGLNQRYNNVWLNNGPTPSSETDVKAFSFDVIPSGLIDNILIFKTVAPELPADFAGGFIKISTKNMPDENFVSLDYAASYRTATTFSDFYKYKGGKTDWLGFDDGTRALPKGFPSNLSDINDAATIDALSKAFNKNWTATASKGRPDQRMGITFGKKIKLEHSLLGNTTAISYSNSLNNSPLENSAFLSYNVIQDQPEYRYKYHDDIYTNNTKVSVLHNWSWDLGKKQKIEFRNLFNQIGFNRTTLRDGHDYNNGIDIKSYEYRFLSRSTYSGQIAGEHSFNEDITKFDWNIGYAYANRLEPDRKVLTTKLNDNTGLYELSLPFTANPRQAGRLYLDNHEHIFSHAFNFETKIDLSSHLLPTLKVGYYLERKMREFNARNLGYAYGQNFDPTATDLLSRPFDQIFQDENFDYTNKIKIAEATSKSDSYSSDNTLIAGYAAFAIPFSINFNLYGGVRAEFNKMALASYRPGLNTPVNVDAKHLNFFPSINMSYNFTEKTLVRMAYGRSINRPEFREIAPFTFYDFNEVATISGNPDLKDAIIQNLDLRFEYYPSSSEVISLALFYKDFKDPIELVYEDAGSGLQYSFQNAKGATNMGIELEVRKSLENILGLKNFSVVLNGSLIQSKVKFPEELKDIEVDRPLFGQSPYIVNTGIFYQNPKIGLMLSANYNVIGKRITLVGIRKQNSDDNIPDTYEMPRNLVDLTFSKKVGKHLEIKGGVKDLLSPPVKFQQTFVYQRSTDLAEQKRTFNTRNYSMGAVYSLGVSLKF